MSEPISDVGRQASTVEDAQLGPPDKAVKEAVGMEWKNFLTDSGLAVIIGTILAYGSGWQYFVGLFHDFETEVYFGIPLERGLAEGVPATAVITTVMVLVALVGYAAKSKLWSNHKNWLYLSLIIPIAVAPTLVHVADVLGVHSVSEQLTDHLRFKVLVPVALTSSYLIVIRPFVRPIGVAQYAHFGVSFALFVCMVFYYSTLLGHAAATRLSLVEEKATLILADADLRERYADTVFVPIMERSDDLILVAYPREEETRPDQSGRRLVLIKRSLIKAVNF
jgi:uncharacterized protein (DUF983 family)